MRNTTTSFLFLSSSSPTTYTPSLCSRHDTPGADLVVGVAGEQGLAVGAPGEADALGLAALLALLDVLGLELVDLALLLEVEDGDAAAGRRAQPVAVRREHERVDFVPGVQRVQVLGLVEIPQHRRAVLAAGRAQRAVGRDRHRVDVAGVTDVVGLETAGSELPDLDAVSRLSEEKARSTDAVAMSHQA